MPDAQAVKIVVTLVVSHVAHVTPEKTVLLS